MYINMSDELKVEILNAAKKRNQMFAKWIDICASIAFSLVLVIALINATALKQIVFQNNEDLATAITIFTVILSVYFDFILKTDRYKENVFIINEILKTLPEREKFSQEFLQNIHLITELDVARARYDICIKLKTFNELSLQQKEDRLQPIDKVTMKRQRYIIITLLVCVVLFVGMVIFANKNPMLFYIIPGLMIIIGLSFMILDATGEKRAVKMIRNLYKEEE